MKLLKLAATDKERNSLLRKYWGEDAHCYNDYYGFPKRTSWEDIYEILTTQNARSASVYLKVDENSFSHYFWEQMRKEEEETEKKWGISDALNVNLEYQDFWDFEAKGIKEGVVYVNLDLASPDKIIVRKAIREGSHGDEDGYGVEPDTWVSAVLDRNGNFVQPFYLGYY